MVIAAVIIISLLLLVLFFAVTIAGGRAHDRQNREAARRDERLQRESRGPNDSVPQVDNKLPPNPWDRKS